MENFKNYFNYWKINLILDFFWQMLSNDDKTTTFEINNTKLYIPVVTLSTQDNVKLLQQLK